MTRIHSMTGFGRHSSDDGCGIEAAAELRTVNGKVFKLSVRLPPRLAGIEEAIRNRIRESVRRGSVYLSISFRSPNDAPAVRVFPDVMKSYVEALEKVSESLGLQGGLDLTAVAALPGCVESSEATGEPSQAESKCLMEALSGAIAALDESRVREGAALAADVSARSAEIRSRLVAIESRAPKVVEEYAKRLENRLHELLGGREQPSPESLRAEVVIFAERSDIHEECVRALNHLDELDRALASGGETGRKLDFLSQELHREVNTINSKANDYEIAKAAVACKVEIDKIKEQVQNIE